jgi:hypothetical protein
LGAIGVYVRDDGAASTDDEGSGAAVTGGAATAVVIVFRIVRIDKAMKCYRYLDTRPNKMVRSRNTRRLGTVRGFIRDRKERSGAGSAFKPGF